MDGIVATGSADERELSGSASKQDRTKFESYVERGSFKQFIDPRETVATLCFSERQRQVLWWMYSNHFISIPLCCMQFAGVVCCIISVLGYYPELGYCGFLQIPFVAMFILHFNLSQCQALFKSFNYWSMILLSGIAWGGITDAVGHDHPGRFIGAVFLGLGNVIQPMADARSPLKRKSYVMAVLYSFIATMSWFLIIMWYTGNWRNVQQTIVRVDNVSIDIQSMSMSCLITCAVLMTKYAWIAWTSKEVNPNLLIHARVAYRLVGSRSPTTSAGKQLIVSEAV